MHSTQTGGFREIPTARREVGSSPGLGEAVLNNQFAIGSEAVIQHSDFSVRTRGEGLVDVEEDGLVGVVLRDVLAHELGDPAKGLVASHGPFLLLHDWSVPGRLQQDVDFANRLPRFRHIFSLRRRSEQVALNTQRK